MNTTLSKIERWIKSLRQNPIAYRDSNIESLVIPLLGIYDISYPILSVISSRICKLIIRNDYGDKLEFYAEFIKIINNHSSRKNQDEYLDIEISSCGRSMVYEMVYFRNSDLLRIEQQFHGKVEREFTIKLTQLERTNLQNTFDAISSFKNNL